MNFGIIVFCIVVLGVVAYLLASGHLDLNNSTDDDDDEYEDEVNGGDHSSIFYGYNHDSEEQWLNWINEQEPETKQRAADLLEEHLLGETKHHGYITLEVLDAVGGLTGVSLDQTLVQFMENCVRTWSHFKAVPSYYLKAAESLIKINPALALQVISKELNKKGTTQAILERKRGLIDYLPELKEISKDTMVNVLTSGQESYGTKAFALRKCEKYQDSELKYSIFLEALKKTIDKNKNNTAEVSSEETHFTQDLIKECIKLIGRYSFFKVVYEASSTPRFHGFVVRQVLKVLESNREKNLYDLLAISKLKDNTQNEIKRTLCKKFELTPVELNQIVLHKTTEDHQEQKLLNEDKTALNLPIPAVLATEYQQFSNAFLDGKISKDLASSEKTTGGCLVAGNGILQKLYFARALAKEQGWNFAHIDIANIKDKESFDEVNKVFGSLRKPFLLYIVNPHLLFEKDPIELAGLRDRFAQTLTIQGLDSKSFLLGDIPVTGEKIKTSAISNKLTNLKNKYFPKLIEINEKEDEYKKLVVDEYLKSISRSRFNNRRRVAEQLLEEGGKMNPIEFAFFVVKSLQSMLMIFGRDKDLKTITKLEKNFRTEQISVDDFEEESNLEAAEI